MIRIHIMSYIDIIEFLNDPEKARIKREYPVKTTSHQLALFPT